MSKILQWLKKEIAILIPIIAYFLICFSLLHCAQNLLLQPGEVHYTNYLGALIGAVFAGKVILIAENISIINSFSRKPLIYNITWKFLIYSFFVLLFQIVEHLTHKFYATDSWSISYIHLITDLSHSKFWGIQIMVLMIFFIFTVFDELASVIGRARMKRIFFG